MRPPIQHPLAIPLFPPSHHLTYPVREPEAPMARDQHAAHDVDDFEQEAQDAGAVVLLDEHHDGLDVVLDEDARDGTLAYE